MKLTENFQAGVMIPFNIPGHYFKFDSVPAGLVTARFFKDSRELYEDLRDVTAGWSAKPAEGFDRVEVTSSLTQAVSFYIARGVVDSNVFSGSVVVTSLPGHSYGTAYASSTVFVANTPQNVLAAGSNVNGVLVVDGEAISFDSGASATGVMTAFLAKATAPTSAIDGDVILQSSFTQFVAATVSTDAARLGRQIIVASGKRLDWISARATTTGQRKALYTVL